MSVAYRMYLLIFVAVLGLFTLSGVSYIQMDKVFNEANKINLTGVPEVEQLDKTLANFEVLNGLIWQHMATTDNADMKKIEGQVANTHQSLMENLKKYESLVVDDKDKALLEGDLYDLDRIENCLSPDKIENRNLESLYVECRKS